MKLTKIPQHIAIIMDGNGRWARKRHLPRVMGHQKGAETVRMVIETCVDLGIPYVTLYAFSQENWKRPKAEINFLMKLLDRYLDSELEAFKKEGIRFSTIGHVGVLPERTQLRLERMKQETKANRKLTVVLALNYGARQEILDAVQRFVSDLSRSNGAYSRRLKALNEKVFSQYLDTAAMPDPDLVIRTSGEYGGGRTVATSRG